MACAFAWVCRAAVAVVMASVLVRRMWKLAGIFVRNIARKEQHAPDEK